MPKLRGIVGNKIKKMFKNGTKELYVKIGSPEEYQKLVRKGVSLELADATSEILNLKKQLESQEKYIESLQDKLGKEENKEIRRQEKEIKKHKKSNEFIIYFRPERPIVVVSSFNAEPFADQHGKKRSFLVGIKLVASPYGPYIVPILADRPKNFKEVSFLETSPQLYLYKITEFLSDSKLLVHKMKASGIVEANVSPEGYFISDQMQIQVAQEISNKKKGD